MIATRKQVIEKVLREQGVKFPRAVAAEIDSALQDHDKDLDKAIDRAGLEISRARTSLATSQRLLEDVARRSLCNARNLGGSHGRCALPMGHPGPFHLNDEGEKFSEDGWPVVPEADLPEKEE